MKSYPFEQSLWAHTAAPAPDTAPLEEEKHADVVVIGGGYTGLSTALRLAQRKVKVVVLEAEQTGYGGSGRNAGHCSPTFIFYTPNQIVELLGPDFGPRMVQLQSDAANLVFGLIKQYDIDCEAAQNGVIYAAHTPSKLAACEALCNQYAKLGKQCVILDRDRTNALTGSDKYHGAWFHPEGGHLNPLGYARGLARAVIEEGGQIYTSSPVTTVHPEGARWRAVTTRGSVLADKVVIGTNAYTGDFWPRLNETFYRLVAFNVASSPLGENVRRTVLPQNNNVQDTRKDTHYYKIDKDGRIVTGTVVNWRRGIDQQYSFEKFGRRFSYLFPQIGELQWQYMWHGYLAMMPRKLPSLYELAPGVITAIGYSGRGVPTATAMGTVLADFASGAAPKELALPLSTAKPLNGRRLLSLFVPSVAGLLHRWEDRRSMRQADLDPPKF
ncbi:MAG: FAD-binding oxidoreductase [Gammaproteobacteria bacterium]|nr:FAD-binding oxidoreductase [Gammaproteobacteria bacterium]